MAVAGSGVLSACSGAKPVARVGAPSPTVASPAPLVRSSPLADACTLATAAQVSAAFGGTAAAGVGGTFALVPICEFALTASPVGVSGVQIWALVNTQASAFQGKQPGGVAVAGVGDAAYYFASLHQLTFIRNGRAVLVRGQFQGTTPAPADPSALKSAAVALGKAIAAGL